MHNIFFENARFVAYLLFVEWLTEKNLLQDNKWPFCIQCFWFSNIIFVLFLLKLMKIYMNILKRIKYSHGATFEMSFQHLLLLLFFAFDTKWKWIWPENRTPMVTQLPIDIHWFNIFFFVRFFFARHGRHLFLA